MRSIKISANQGWKFYRGEPPKGRVQNSENPHDSGLPPYDVLLDDSTWETVHLPHTVRNEKLMCSGGLNYQGECWYRKKFAVSEEWNEKELYFEFEGAMQRVDAWLDGEPIGYQTGGFLPMRFEIRGVSAGEHLLAIKVDNSDMKDVPPAKPQGALDFCYFGGLYRNAWFYVTDKVRFSYAVHEGKMASGGLFVRTKLEDKKAIVSVNANWLNHTDNEVCARVRLLLNGQPVYESVEMTVEAMKDGDVECRFVVENPSLWHPAHPVLYELTAQLLHGREVLDERTEKIGLRTLEFRQDAFYINGEKLFLNGTNRHQEYAYIGFALPDSLQKRDVHLLRKAGVNCIRTAHYPPDETFMNACDEEGILCIIPTPGWQIHPASVAFDEASYENTRRMIRLLRNHAGACLWEPILNETDYPAYFAQKQYDIVKEESLDLPAWCACDSHSRLAEIYPVNYGDTTRKQARPLFVREYGDFYMEQYGPMDTLRRVRRGAHTNFYPGGEAAMIRSAQERFEAYVHLYHTEHMNGAATWAGMDHNRGYEPNEAAVGMLDFLRLPKFHYHYFDCQQDIEKAGAKCFIANYWTETSPRDVVVYTNAESVRLFLNGKEIGCQKTNGSSGIHPSVVFENVVWESGKLLAEALVGETVVATYKVCTPKEAHHLQLTPQWENVEIWTADGSDLLMVHVAVVDEDGNLVPYNESAVRFCVEGDARIVGKDEPWVQADQVKLEAGQSGVLLRAGVNSAEVVLTAEADGLGTAVLKLNTMSDQKQYLPGESYTETAVSPTYPCDETEYFSVRESIKSTQSQYWDISTGKRASASSCGDGTKPENINKESISAPWIAAEKTMPQWWMCDLQERCQIYGVAISWLKDGLWYDYDIETSIDGVAWERQLQGHASGQTRLPDRFSKVIEARYLRVMICAVSGNEVAGMYHVEVFGKKSSKEKGMQL